MSIRQTLLKDLGWINSIVTMLWNSLIITILWNGKWCVLLQGNYIVAMLWGAAEDVIIAYQQGTAEMSQEPWRWLWLLFVPGHD
jgi:hypothetical protein